LIKKPIGTAAFTPDTDEATLDYQELLRLPLDDNRLSFRDIGKDA
jgi:hypothetical protein